MDYTVAGSGQIEALCGESGRLYERLKQLEDRRDPRGVRYPLAAVLIIMMLAWLSGEDDNSRTCRSVCPGMCLSEVRGTAHSTAAQMA